MSEELVLLPVPQKLTRLDGRCNLEGERFILLAGTAPANLLFCGGVVQEALAALGARWQITAAPGESGAVVMVDPAQVPRPEGYRLSIRRNQIRLLAHDLAGALHGAMTLRQIARQCAAGTLPCLLVEDWPDFPNRGVMLDISRDKVPTMETLYALVDLFAEWKLNQLQLYTEHTFAYRAHREVWEESSPITGEEVLALDTYCRQRGIELVPNQNSFGHLTRWLIHPRYRPLAEAPDGFTLPWGGRRDQPFSLCPLDPGSIRLLEEWYDELLPHFSSRQFNVGLDETFDLGQGRSRQACAERGTGRVYLEFLLKIHALVRRHGRTMQFWGDIIMHHPELIPELPDDLIALEWGYEANHPFASDGQKFAAAGVPYYVCPGTSSWNTLAGRTENAVGNLRNAAENGLAHGAIGYLNTDWGDNGYWQYLPISFLGYAYGAALSWALASNRDLDLPTALSRHAFRDAAMVMGRLAYDLGNAYRETGVLTHNASVLHSLLLNPDIPLAEGRLAGLSAENLRRTEAFINQVTAPLPQARMERPDAALIVEEYQNTAALLRHACRLGVARLEAADHRVSNIAPSTRASLAADLEEILARYRRLWAARNRPGGLTQSAGRLERLLRAYRAA
ncbi:MAG: glycoside hydrolase family 20 zincin-like fold domain-containing protein [Armatimonadota bacterium]|nr:glycoside hydrolase family 20 zincin-like fold domain-containing protein [Armatimonadota bacterium]